MNNSPRDPREFEKLSTKEKARLFFILANKQLRETIEVMHGNIKNKSPNVKKCKKEVQEKYEATAPREER